MIGYVATGYGAVPLATVEAQIDAYRNWYHLDGIFVDQMTNDGSNLAYYQSIYEYVHSQQPGWIVVGNPGSNTPEAYAQLPVADILVLFENGYGYGTYTPPSWQQNYPADRFANIVYGVPDAGTMQADLQEAAAQNTGWVYFTDDSLPNPYDTLPSYFTQFAAAAGASPGAGGQEEVNGDFTFTYTDSLGHTSSTAPTSAGAYSVQATFTSNDLNYANSTSSAVSFTIYQRALTVTANGVNKTYDGTTVASVTLSDDRVSGDAVTDSYASASFADKNVGTAKRVTVSGIAISGTDAGNYTFNSTASTTANIGKRALTVTAIGDSKVYDRTTAVTVTLSDNRVSADNLTDSYVSASFSSKTVGTGKTVSVTGISISGADAGNYNLQNTAASTTANITPRPLTVTATGINKVYDGTTTATVTLSDNHLGGDTVTDAYAAAAFGDPVVGNGKTVTVTGITTSGADAANYSANTTATTTANITSALSTVVLQADPADPTKTALVVGGTVKNDTIIIQPDNPAKHGGVSGYYTVSVNGTTTFANVSSWRPTGHIIVFGVQGNDTIQLKKNTFGPVTIPALVFGGVDGNNTLDASGSTANNVLVGGSGNDTVFDGSRYNILIGGLGNDSLNTGGPYHNQNLGTDILIGDDTTYDTNTTALLGLVAEWGRTDITRAQKITDLTSVQSGSKNGSFLLTRTGASPTIIDDKVADSIFSSNPNNWQP